MLKLAFEIDGEKIKFGLNLMRKYDLFLYRKNIYDLLISPIQTKEEKKPEKKERKIKEEVTEEIKSKAPDLKKIIRIIKNFREAIKYDSASVEIPMYIINEPELFPVLAFIQEIPEIKISISEGTKIKILFKAKIIQVIKLVLILIKF